MADLHVEKFAAILNWGCEGWIDVNPCAGIERLHESSRLDKVWSWEQEAIFLAGKPELDKPPARPDLIEAYLLAVWLGLREGDLVSLLASEYDGEKVRRELQKRARRRGRPRPPKRVTIPVGGPVKPVIGGMKGRLGLDVADVSERARTKLLLNSEGRPWASGASFYEVFHRECVRLGIEDRTFHDLRRTAVTRLAIAGCTEAEIKSITGHSISEIKDILEVHYLYLDPQIAINAIKKLENSTLHIYAQFIRQFIERRLNEAKSGTQRPTERPTEVT